MSNNLTPPWRKYIFISAGLFIIVIIIGAGLVLTAPQQPNFIKYKKAPNFTLVDQNNNTVTLKTYLGKVLMIDFIYTHCPNPNGTLGECSTETANMNNLLMDLQNKGLTQKDFHFISVSIDWKYDNVSSMYNYGKARAEGQFQYWSFLSGTQQEIDNVTTGYDIYVEYANSTINTTLPLITSQPSSNNQVEYISHNLMAYLIDKNGFIRILTDSSGGLYPISGTTWIPKDVMNQIIALIND